MDEVMALWIKKEAITGTNDDQVILSLFVLSIFELLWKGICINHQAPGS